MRLIDANEVVENIVAERDKIPYELVSGKPFKHGNSMRGGIRKALYCVEQAPTVAAVPVVRCEKCVAHGNCFAEHVFVYTGIENPYCCAGDRKEGADNEP